MEIREIVPAVAVFLAIALIAAEPALAGPGGAIAKAVAVSLWAKSLLIALTVVLLPLIITIVIKEKMAERRALKDLRFMSGHNRNFEWPRAKQRVLDCFTRVHASWSREDVSDAAEFMSDWYWQNQQLAKIGRWERDGLTHRCAVDRVRNLRPLLFVHRNDGNEHDGSLLVVAIDAHMCDCVVAQGTGSVVEGEDEFGDLRTIWSLTMSNGKWRVSNIERDHGSLAYTKLAADLPKIQDTLLSACSRTE